MKAVAQTLAVMAELLVKMQPSSLSEPECSPSSLSNEEECTSSSRNGDKMSPSSASSLTLSTTKVELLESKVTPRLQESAAIASAAPKVGVRSHCSFSLLMLSQKLDWVTKARCVH